MQRVASTAAAECNLDKEISMVAYGRRVTKLTRVTPIQPP